MIEVRVGLGNFEVSLEQLMALNQGQHFEFSVESGQSLELFVGEEKIAEAKLVIKQNQYYIEISKMLLTQD